MKKYLSYLPYLLILVCILYNNEFNLIINFIKGFGQIFIFIISRINEICVTMYGNIILSELFSHLITFKLVGILLTIVALIVPSGRLLKYTGKVLYKIFDNIVSTILDNICKLI